MWLHKVIPLVLLCSGLAGCIPSGGTPILTPYPPDYLPTVVALTGQSAYATSFAQSQTVTPIVPTIEIGTNTPTITPSPEATSTPTPEPGFDEFAQIRFLSPGPMSKIISPLQIQMLIVSGESDLVQIELLGEDGRKLFSKLERVKRQATGAYRTMKIPFEFRAAAELGWLQISSKDDQNRIQALNSLHILLQSTGTNEINPPGNIIYERVVLETPDENAQNFDDVLEVKGRFWPMNAQPVFLELISSTGKVLGARVYSVDGIEPQYFETTIPYKLPLSENTVTPMPLSDVARLTIRQVDPVLGIPLYIFTRLVRLMP